MIRYGAIIAVSMLLASAIADDTVSNIFTFDAHYDPSGVTPDAWVSYADVEVSDRFMAATVARKVDLNANGIPDAWEELYGLTGDNARANADPDGDGRTNIEEYNAGTNPILPQNYALSSSVSETHTVDTWLESTADPFGALVEMWAVSSLFTVNAAGRALDSEKDGMPDWWENLYGLDPLVDDAHADPDGDGRTNIQEYNAGTSPILIDDWTRSVSEGADPFECDTRVWYTGGNPSFDTAFAVVQVSNGFICDTGGLYYDWDGDGIPNWWEARYSRSGSKTGLVAEDDNDEDGVSNFKEFVAYTNPTDSKSKFIIGLEPIRVEPVQPKKLMLKSFAAASNDSSSRQAFKLSWQSAKGRTYGVYTCANLASGWSDKPDVELQGTGDVIEYVPQTMNPAMFFKVTVRLTDDY